MNMFITPYRSRKSERRIPFPKPFCQCWNKRTPQPWKQLDSCTCGENDGKECEWKWERPPEAPSWIVISNDQKQVTFHQFYSSGTAVAKGDTPMLHDYHYYWEVKMLTETYGTDIMVGLGSNKVDITDSQFKFISLLGQDAESYGFSYRGSVRHNSMVCKDSVGFCRGSIIGVRVDMWKGTLEFYVNRIPQGVAFYNLRRHQTLYPMVCSTAAQSSMKLIYASSWRASLLVDAAKVLAASVNEFNRPLVPPGLWNKLKSQFWMTMPSDGPMNDDDLLPVKIHYLSDDESFRLATDVFTDILPNEYMNGFYVDNIDREYRVVVWQAS